MATSIICHGSDQITRDLNTSSHSNILSCNGTENWDKQKLNFPVASTNLCHIYLLLCSYFMVSFSPLFVPSRPQVSKSDISWPPCHHHTTQEEIWLPQLKQRLGLISKLSGVQMMNDESWVAITRIEIVYLEIWYPGPGRRKEGVISRYISEPELWASCPVRGFSDPELWRHLSLVMLNSGDRLCRISLS